jgi:predicted transcriptional regulator
MATLSVRLPEDLAIRLEEDARLSHRTRGELVREALASYFQAKERARVEEGLGVASQLVRKESMRILAEFEPVDPEALESAEGHHP